MNREKVCQLRVYFLLLLTIKHKICVSECSTFHTYMNNEKTLLFALLLNTRILSSMNRGRQFVTLRVYHY